MELVNWIKTLVVDYGAINVIIMLLIIIVTNLIKKPIIEKADEFVATAKRLTDVDVDKSVITSNICYIPIGISFVLYFIYYLVLVKFDFTAFAWSTWVSTSITFGLLSTSVYEIGKIKIKSFLGKKSYTEAKQKIKIEQTGMKDLLLNEEKFRKESNQQR